MKPRGLLKSEWNRMEKGFQYTYINRRLKKRNYRRLWIVQINNGLINHSYSSFISALKKNKIIINRKMLANLAQYEPKIFQSLTKFI